MALASGNRVSELATLDEGSVVFHRDLPAMTILVRRVFLFKNETVD